ncbi:unnamed protein product [Schistosoma margrebowiei]|uniref:Uncharacterized protein n=1 Tax=Schistosoma margrebowiei TaxID=48269 RepID=A0A183N926_9TREM|nr:unnamed protein product [Schistosoma margrebowiei]
MHMIISWLISVEIFVYIFKVLRFVLHEFSVECE